jgi:hypothetical protein
VAEEMVRGKAIKLRCKSCQHIIPVPAAASGAAPQNSGSQGRQSGPPRKEGAVPWDGLSAVAMPTHGEAPWFAMIKGRQSGPLQSKDLESRFKAGDIGRRTYVWREGMTDWKRAEDVPELCWIFEPEAGSDAGVGGEANHRRETFDSMPAASAAVQERPRLKLSPDLLAASPEAGRQTEKERARKPSQSQPALWLPGEETRFFIAEAGMNKRNPPWKIAAFVASLIALPAAVLYLLATFKVGPLVVTRVDASGREVTESVFSSEGSALRDLLSGRRAAQPAASIDSRHATRTAKPPPSPKPVEAPAPLPRPPPASPDLRAFYGDSSHVDVGPTARRQPKRPEETSGGLAQGDVSKVVAQTQPAFQFCIEQEMKKNPSFRGGKIFINAVIGSSGTVKQAAISRPDIDASSLGECLKTKARRMVFSAFSGDDTEVQIPLILTTSL